MKNLIILTNSEGQRAGDETADAVLVMRVMRMTVVRMDHVMRVEMMRGGVESRGPHHGHGGWMVVGGRRRG